MERVIETWLSTKQCGYYRYAESRMSKVSSIKWLSQIEKSRTRRKRENENDEAAVTLESVRGKSAGVNSE